MNHPWGLTKHGFKAKDLDAIKNELESALQKQVDPTLNFGDGTVAGQLTAIVANQIRQVWEMAADLFTSLDANTAKGRSLEALCALTGTHRRRGWCRDQTWRRCWFAASSGWRSSPGSVPCRSSSRWQPAISHRPRLRLSISAGGSGDAIH